MVGLDLLPLIGAHVSTAGGFAQVPARAQAIGAEAVQVFSSNPRTWHAAPPDLAVLAGLGAALGRDRIPLYLHAIYLVNLASPEAESRTRSALAVAHALVTGALCGAAGVVTHVGSHRGAGFDKASPLVRRALQLALLVAERSLAQHYPPAAGRSLPRLLLETGAGSGATMGASLEELAALLSAFQAPRHRPGAPSLGLCLDTAHLFAAGYAIHQLTGLAALVTELRERRLLDLVGLIHLNDSAMPFASRRDRHADPGEGELGYAGLAGIVRHPVLAGIPFILEVPGSDGHGPGADEVALVKTMRTAAPSRPPTPADAGSDPEARV